MRRLFEERLEKKAFRMSIILMLRDLEPAERSRAIDKLTTDNMRIPYSKKNTLSRATIYRWLQEYENAKDPFDALIDKTRSDRGFFRSLTEEQKNALINWRSENLYRTVENLREELLVHEETSDSSVPSVSTIARFLRSVGLDKKSMKEAKFPEKKKIRLPFEAEYPQQIWQADTKGPQIEVIIPETGELKIAKPIVVLDDYSRYILTACYVIEETEATLMQILKMLVATYGVPETLYCDLGSPYVGGSLKHAMLLLGSKVCHTCPRDPSAKGKIEKVMPWFTEHLESELMALGKICTLDEVNEYADAIVSVEYQKKRHSITGESPEERYNRLPIEYRRFVSQKALSMAFLQSKTAHVSKTGMISFQRQKYLVPDNELFTKKVTIRFDLSDISKIYVWYEDNYYGEANLYIPDNDPIKRQNILEGLDNPKPTPKVKLSPKYTYLERRLAAYREELENQDISKELEMLREQKERIRADLRGKPSNERIEESGPFDVSRCLYLLCLLLRRNLTPAERFQVHAVWDKCGPFDEEIVRSSVGEMLGKNHPTSDLTSYLEAIKISALVGHRKKDDICLT